jgi:hypothetical protein
LLSRQGACGLPAVRAARSPPTPRRRSSQTGVRPRFQECVESHEKDSPEYNRKKKARVVTLACFGGQQALCRVIAGPYATPRERRTKEEAMSDEQKMKFIGSAFCTQYHCEAGFYIEPPGSGNARPCAGRWVRHLIVRYGKGYTGQYLSIRTAMLCGRSRTNSALLYQVDTVRLIYVALHRFDHRRTRNSPQISWTRHWKCLGK